MCPSEEDRPHPLSADRAVFPKAAGGASVARNDAYERERYDRAAADVERLLDKMAEKAACEQLENERITGAE